MSSPLTHPFDDDTIDLRGVTVYTNEIHRGDIFYADLSPAIGSEQDGFRPVLIIQNDVGNNHSPTVIVAPISSQIKKVEQPTHVLLPSELELPEESMVLLEQIRTVDKARLDSYITTADDKTMRTVNKAIRISLGLVPNKSTQQNKRLTLCLCPTCASAFYQSKDHYIRRVDLYAKTKEPCDFCRIRRSYDFTIYPTKKKSHASDKLQEGLS